MYRKKRLCLQSDNSNAFPGKSFVQYLTIIPRAHEGERNNRFSKIQLVGQKNIETKLKARLKFALSRRFSLQVGYNK